MRILLINQYGPPDTSPTARLAGDLSHSLQDAGHEVAVISTSSRASGYRKKYRGGLRILAELYSLLSLLCKSIGSASADQVIVFSSPPMVLLVGVWAGKFHRSPVTHWVLDAYPDVAIQLGAGGPAWLQRGLQGLMQAAYRCCDQIVAVSPAMQEMLAGRYQVNSTVIPPWPPDLPVAGTLNKGNANGWGQVQAGYGVWCYSGNLGKAHEWSVLLDVQQELERRQVPLALVIQGGGEGWLKVRQEAPNRGIRQVVLKDYVEEAELVERLNAATVRVATLKPEMSGLLWPSKWAMIDCLPGPHLWIGPAADLGEFKSSDVFQFAVEDYLKIADWLEAIAKRTTQRPPLDAAAVKLSVDHKRSNGLNEWQRLLAVPLR